MRRAPAPEPEQFNEDPFAQFEDAPEPARRSMSGLIEAVENKSKPEDDPDDPDDLAGLFKSDFEEFGDDFFR